MEQDGDGDFSEVQTSDVPRSPNPELKKLLVFKVYKRRWFVLLVLCLLNCSNAMVSKENKEMLVIIQLHQIIILNGI